MIAPAEPQPEPALGPEAILDLQWEQLAHDESFHKDVIVMSLPERMKHMALHMAKYTGYLAEALGTPEEPERTARVLTDAFIITLAGANTLNQDLGHELLGQPREGRTAVAAEPPHSRRGVDRPDGPATGSWFLREFAIHAGSLAKACESHDHLEAYPFREAMGRSNLALFRLVVAEAGARGLDIVVRYRRRLREVEGRSILRGHLRPADRAATG